MPQDIPKFIQSDLRRWYPGHEGLVVAERELWAWVANSYRLRGCGLIRCVTEANNALRRAAASHQLKQEMNRKRWCKSKRRRKVGRKAATPKGKPAAALRVAANKKRARRLAAELRLKRDGGRALYRGGGGGG
jgi:hypothetical protein